MDDISEPGDSPRTPVPGQADSSSPDYEFGEGTADDAPMAGQKRRQNSPEDEQRRKASKDDLAASLKKDAPVHVMPNARRIPAALPSGGSGNSGVNPAALPSGGSSDARRMSAGRGRRN